MTAIAVLHAALIGVPLLALTAVAQEAPVADPADLLLLGEVVFEGRVREVVGDDSLAIEHRGREVVVQLARVAVPDDPALREGLREALARQVGRLAEVRLESEATPPARSYGRVVVGEDLRLGFVEAGLLLYCPGSRKELALETAEQRAEARRRGFWAAAGPTARERLCSEKALQPGR